MTSRWIMHGLFLCGFQTVPLETVEEERCDPFPAMMYLNEWDPRVFLCIFRQYNYQQHRYVCGEERERDCSLPRFSMEYILTVRDTRGSK